MTYPGHLDTLVNVLMNQGIIPGLMTIKGSPNYRLFSTSEGPRWFRREAIFQDKNMEQADPHTQVSFEEVFESLPNEQKEPLLYHLDLLIKNEAG